MKKFFTLLIVFAFTIDTFSQAPEKMSYQAVIRNSNGELVKNSSIGMQMIILQGSETGTSVFVERHFPSTNSNGLVTVEIGGGLLISGGFDAIDWSAGPYFIKTETDLNGGANYTISGISQVLSVPYALYSKTAGGARETDPVWTGASANYYTKINQQTSGQSQLHWENLTNIDADVLDLSDGSLTGTKIGPGISTSNLSGTVAVVNGGTGAATAAAARTNLGLGTLATLSSVGSAQITDGSITSSDIADNTITSADVSTIGADKISGILADRIPKSDGSSLVNGSILDNGTTLGIGGQSGTNKLTVETASSGTYIGIYGNSVGNNVLNYGVFGNANSASNISYGVYGNAIGTTSGNYNYGLYGNAASSSTGTAHAYGVTGYSRGTGADNRGIYACAYNGTINYAVFATANGGTANWAGYFQDGNIYIADQILSPNLTSATGTTLVLDASGWIRKLSSDISLKENISPLQNSLEKVLQLQGVNFTWRSDNDHLTDIGFIAQDVQEVIPELVVEDKNDGLLSVKYQNLVAVLAEAIKEQQKQIDELKQQIKSLMQK